jgi:hypothetical protein
MAKKKIDPKAKAKRQKIIAGVGGVLLLAILAIQVPRTMKLMNSSQDQSASSTPSTTTTSGTPPLAPPSLAGSSTTSSAGGSGALASSSEPTSADGVSDPSPLPPGAGQLISFSRFKSKDPFKQQIVTSCGADATSASATGTSCAAGARNAPKKAAAKTATPGITLPAPRSAPARVQSAKPTRAVISVNGLNSTVSVGAAFPSGAPVFTLVSLKRSWAKIGIAGGSYESGAATVTLTKGKAITLMNTADGTRYVLRLVSTA